MNRKRTVRNSDFIEVDVCEGDVTIFKGAFYLWIPEYSESCDEDASETE